MTPLLTIVLLVVTTCGISLLSAHQSFKGKIILSLVGTLFGFSIFTAITFISTWITPLSPLSITIQAIVLALATYLISKNKYGWKYWKSAPIDKTGLAIFIILFLLFSLISPKLLIETKDGLETGVINAYGDIGFHAATITILQDNNSIIPQNPILSGHPLTYPFFSNFFSSILMATGLSISQAIVLPALILIPLTLTLLYYLVLSLTRSKTAAIIALLLFLFSGATVGWIQITSDLETSNLSLLDFFKNLPRNYTGHSDDPKNLNIINPIISMLLPQRAFLFGMPLAFTILLLLNDPRKRATSFIFAGIAAGLMPIFHAHTVIALIPAILALFAIKPSKAWLTFFLTTGAIGIPSILYYISSPSSSSTLPHLQLGWMSQPDNFIIYWLKNTGLVVPIAIIGLFSSASRELKALSVAGLLIFTSANIWIFAAWEWDNTKLFVYSTLFFLPIIAYLASQHLKGKSIAIRGLIFALIIFHLLSGALDIYKLALPESQQWGEWDNHGIIIADKIRSSTKPEESIANAAQHNSAVALSGRPMYLGFPGHIWTHGEDFGPRQESLKRFYDGEIKTLPETPTSYVLVGPQERHTYPNLTIQPHWQLVAQSGPYSFYKVAP